MFKIRGSEKTSYFINTSALLCHKVAIHIENVVSSIYQIVFCFLIILGFYEVCYFQARGGWGEVS